jgi:hypothetical protein
MNDLVNVSVGKKAAQSSYSKWSTPGEAEQALFSDTERKFAFHTDGLEHPWWQVDLGDIYPIHSIVVGNRSDKLHQKARTLRVEISRDGENWFTVHRGFMIWRYEHRFEIENELVGRFVRLSLEEKSYLHLSKVEVWSRRSPLKVVSNRNDGLGCRLEAVVRGAYLAKVLNCDFKVRWSDQILGPGAEFSGQQDIAGQAVLGHSVESPYEIFSKDFVDTSFENGVLRNVSNASSEKNLSAAELHQPSLQNEPGVLYAPGGTFKISFNKYLAPNTAFGYPEIFEELSFSDQIQSAINAARAVDLDDKTAALHIRSGDIVFGEYRKQGPRFMEKALSVHLAMMALEHLREEGYQVILFGEDSGALQSLKEMYPNVLVANDFNNGRYSGAAGAFFDIIFMSRTNLTWAANSGFSRFANDISHTNVLQNIHKIFDPAEKIRFLETRIEETKGIFHPLQYAFSLWNLYCKCPDLTFDRRIELLDEIREIDPKNPVYDIEKVCTFLSHGKELEAEVFLKKILLEGWTEGKPWGGTETSEVIIENALHLRMLLNPMENLESEKYGYVSLFLAIVATGKGNFERAKYLLGMAKNANPSDLLISSIDFPKQEN